MGGYRGDSVLCLAAPPLIGLVEPHLPGILEKLFPLSVNTGRRIMRPELQGVFTLAQMAAN